MERIEELPQHKVSMTGMFTDITEKDYALTLNDSAYVYKFIQHHTAMRSVAPFIDDYVLSIKLPEVNIWKCVLALLLCPDLLNIGCVSTIRLLEKYDGYPYDFYEEYMDHIPTAKKILEHWGKEKCDNILKEDI